jgi:hypothetical protein
MTMKPLVFMLACLVAVLAAACNQNAKIPVDENTKIPIKAGLLYKMGGARPVARTKLYLLKAEAKNLDNSDLFISPMTASAVGMGESYAGIQEDRIKDYVVATTTTDFEGNAEFKNIPPRTYYIAAYTRMPSQFGYVVWKVEVNAKKDMETVFLDQNNALDSDK